jgi:hypothetical protein
MLWTANPPSDRAIFLDPEISTSSTNNYLETRTFKPPHGGLPKRASIWKPPTMNTRHHEDYIVSLARHFAERDIEQGHKAKIITPLFMESVQQFAHQPLDPILKAPTDESLYYQKHVQYYFHPKYHHHGMMKRHEICTLFN